MSAAAECRVEALSPDPIEPLGQQPGPIVSHWPSYDADDIAAVVDVLRSGRVNSLHHGDRCRTFEQVFARLCDMPHAIALANGTLALELALRVLGIGPGDEVVVTPRSFVASASCVRACGGIPIFADVDPVSQNLTAKSVEAVLTPRTKAVILVHLAGWPCEMDEFIALARTYRLKIIEDCAQAHGATYKGRPVGSFGDAAAFSFCTDKIISTGGEGGMLLLRDEEAWDRAWSYKDHGKSFATCTEPARTTTFRWLHNSFGSNYRLTEMQAALGIGQLTKLPIWLRSRRRNASLLNSELAAHPALRVALPPVEIGHAYYKYYVFVHIERLKQGWSRDRIIAEVTAAGVPCFSGVCPEIYREKAFVDAGLCPESRLPTARSLGERSLMLPIDQTLDEDDILVMGRTLKSVVTAATN